jgi:hypothetical protein
MVVTRLTTTETSAHVQGGDREERIVFGDPSGGHDRKEEACLDLGQALCVAEKYIASHNDGAERLKRADTAPRLAKFGVCVCGMSSNVRKMESGSFGMTSPLLSERKKYASFGARFARTRYGDGGLSPMKP